VNATGKLKRQGSSVTGSESARGLGWLLMWYVEDQKKG